MEERENGFLYAIRGEFISEALRQLPTPEEVTEDQRTVDIAVPLFGLVRFTCQ